MVPLSTIVVPNMAIYLSRWRMAQSIGSCASTVLTSPKPLYPHKLSWRRAMCLPRGAKPGTKMDDLAASALIATLKFKDGLYYCPTDVYTVDNCPPPPPTPSAFRVTAPTPSTLRRPSRFIPTSKGKLVELELWLLRLGSPGIQQLDKLPGNVTGTPPAFDYHPFRFIYFKEEAQVQKQVAQRLAVRTTKRKQRFYMDFGFIHSSTSDYSRPTASTDCVIFSCDGYSSYLIVIDEASQYVWIFLTASKDPPITILWEFLTQHGHEDGGCIRMDQGGKLARNHSFQDMVLCEFHYTLKPTGADSPSQNEAVEIYNDILAVRTRTLLYGSGLPAKFWSAALVHLAYLHNRLVHTKTGKTPIKEYFGEKPDISSLKLFGSRVWVRRTGARRAKLDRHDFTGIFLGYSASDQNILYLDLELGLVKRSHHARFNEAWYLQPHCPPAAQLLYDLGLEADDSDPPPNDVSASVVVPSAFSDDVPWPCIPVLKDDKATWTASPHCQMIPLPLCKMIPPRPITAIMAFLHSPSHEPPETSLHLHPEYIDGPKLSNSSSPPPFRSVVARTKSRLASDIVTEFMLSKKDMATIYMPPDPYFEAFEEVINLRKFDLSKHCTAGLSLAHSDGRLYLRGMMPSTPCTKIPQWRTQIIGAWLIQIGSTPVFTINDAQQAFQELSASAVPSVTLLFSHPEIQQDISHDGLPIVSSAPFSQQTHDQLNKRWDFSTVADHLCKAPPYEVIMDGDVLNTTTKVMKLTCGKLLQQQDWNDWQESEYLQLNQYEDQGMFGQPTTVSE
jgi:hypothetical protein